MKRKSVFIEYFGDSPSIRVFDVLLEGRGMGLSAREIAKNSGVEWEKFQKIWAHMKKKKIVVGRRYARTWIFKMNMGNEFVRELIRLDIAISKP